MTVLREENSHFAWFTCYISICRPIIFNDVFLFIIFQFRKITKGCKSKSLFPRQRNLNVNHTAMSLQFSFFFGFSLGYLDIHKQVFLLDKVFTFFKLVQIISL